MKFKLMAISLILFAISFNVRAQYKDLEGVFLGKVVGLSVGGSYISYKSKLYGTSYAITPINYSVLISNKAIISMHLSMNKKLDVTHNYNDGNEDYSETITAQLFRYGITGKFAITPDGLEKPTSVFLDAHLGIFLGKRKRVDSRYGDMRMWGGQLFGAGVTVFQRLGSRFLAFAEPSYHLEYSPGSSDQKLAFSHFNGQVGIMFLIGRSSN